MDSKLDKLLEKYWEAETDLQEEVELKALLKESKDPSHESEKGLMDYFEQQTAPNLDDSFDAELLAAIEEPETKVISFNAYFKQYASIAAAVLVMAISSVMFINNQSQYQAEDTFETPEEAYAELKKQLLIVSNYMNKGNNTVSELSTIGSATDEITAIGKMSSAASSLEMLEEMNVSN
jgi:hypothetical protein